MILKRLPIITIGAGIAVQCKTYMCISYLAKVRGFNFFHLLRSIGKFFQKARLSLRDGSLWTTRGQRDCCKTFH
jgi:hypothetical protein